MATMDYSLLGRADNTLDVGEAVYQRVDITSSAATLASGSLRLSYFTAKVQEMISQVRFYSGTTAAGATPTLVRVGIYQVDESTGDLTLVGSTPNDTTLLAATQTQYVKALSAPFLKERGRRYAVGILVVTAAAMPTLAGQTTTPASECAISPRTVAYTAQTDLPASISAGSLTNGSSRIYFVLLP